MCYILFKYWSSAALILQCFDAVGWVIERTMACKTANTKIPKSLLLGTGLTWSNSRKMASYRPGTGLEHCIIGMMLHFHSSGGSTLLYEMTSWPPCFTVWSQIKNQLMHIYMKNITAKFHPHLICIDRTLGFFMKWLHGCHLESTTSSKIRLSQLMQIYSRYNPAKFYSDHIWKDKPLGYFEDGCPSKKKNKVSRDMRSVPDVKTRVCDPHLPCHNYTSTDQSTFLCPSKMFMWIPTNTAHIHEQKHDLLGSDDDDDDDDERMYFNVA